MTSAPAVTDADAVIDAAWFAAHSGRTRYARAAHGWVLVVRQVPQGRDRPPVLLRTCLALWDRGAYSR